MNIENRLVEIIGDIGKNYIPLDQEMTKLQLI